jgi:hypothetical protein
MTESISAFTFRTGLHPLTLPSPPPRGRGQGEGVDCSRKESAVGQAFLPALADRNVRPTIRQ